jgi:hypothetical protein
MMRYGLGCKYYGGCQELRHDSCAHAEFNIIQCFSPYLGCAIGKIPLSHMDFDENEQTPNK